MIFPSFYELRDRQRTTSGLDAFNDFWYSVAGGPTAAGVTINEQNALKYLTVAACVTLIAGDIARLPLILYRRRSDGSRERVRDHPIYDLVHTAPNPETNSFLWREMAEGHCLLWGNTYARIDRNNSTGNVMAIWPVENPGGVYVARDGRGKIFYRWRDPDGRVHKYFRESGRVFHVPGFGYDGVSGLSNIALAREAIGTGLAAEEFSSRFFSQGTHPSLYVSIPPEVKLGDAEKAYKQSLKDTLTGLKNAHGVAVFKSGEKVESLTMPLKDAQFLELRDHQKTELCGYYHVPPHKIALHGANSNYNNLEQENQGYVDSCLSHWVSRWEQCINAQLLTEIDRASGLYFEFKLDALLRGDSSARSDIYKTLFNMGYPLNRILEKENENPVEGGETGFVPLNMIPLDKAGDLADSQISDGNEPPAPTADRGRIIRRETRSLVIRDRITGHFRPIIVSAAGRIVNREAIAVKKQVAKNDKNRAISKMEGWLKEFYRKLPGHIQREMGPALMSYGEAMGEAAADEAGAEFNRAEVEKFMRDYVDRYAERHTASSLGQLMALLEGELVDLETRVDEWTETRPDKIGLRESVQAGSAVFQAVIFGAGLRTVWRTRGKSCPLCRQLDGQVIGRGQSFLRTGDVIDPEDGKTQPLEIKNTVRHPQLHQGCDCYLGIG